MSNPRGGLDSAYVVPMLPRINFSPHRLTFPYSNMITDAIVINICIFAFYITLAY